MEKSFLPVIEQPLVVRLALLFCRTRIETRYGWRIVYKTLNGRHYLVRQYELGKKRYQLLRSK